MILTTSTGVKIANPTDAQIRAALETLDVKRNGDGFAIFDQAEDQFIQVGGDASIGFDAEYQEGGVEHHYRADEDFTLEDVVAFFAADRDGRTDWKSRWTWVLQDLSNPFKIRALIDRFLSMFR